MSPLWHHYVKDTDGFFDFVNQRRAAHACEFFAEAEKNTPSIVFGDE
jgi:hypothetical protein